MALKLKISPSVWEGMPADVKKEYKQDGNDYTLDLEGYEDPEALKRARDHEKAAAADAKRELAAARAAQTAAEKKAKELEDSGKSVDDAVKAKDTEWQTKYDNDIKERDDKYGSLSGTLLSNHKKSIAEALANKISNAPSLLAPRIAERLEVELDVATNMPKHFILGSDNKRTSWTVDDLEKDILKNKEFAPILRGTKATGGGGALPGPGGGGAPRHTFPGSTGTAVEDLSKMPPAELAARIQADKEQRGA